MGEGVSHSDISRRVDERSHDGRQNNAHAFASHRSMFRPISRRMYWCRRISVRIALRNFRIKVTGAQTEYASPVLPIAPKRRHVQ